MEMDDYFVAAALLLMASKGGCDSLDSYDEHDAADSAFISVLSVGANLKPRGGDSQVRRWVTDPFW